MRWAWVDSRLALTLRRLRRRFGISAPRVAVRTELAWHWRVVAVLVLVILALLSARWMFDAGRQIAGFNADETERELQNLRTDLMQREAELAHWRAQASAAESTLAIERSAREQLSSQVRTLELENAHLREELAVFERLASGGESDERVTVEQLRVMAPTEGRLWRYQFLVAQKSGRGAVPFRGSYQLLVTPKGGGAIIQFPRTGGDMARYALDFRHFRRVEGGLDLPAGVQPQRIELRILQQGQVKASHVISP